MTRVCLQTPDRVLACLPHRPLPPGPNLHTRGLGRQLRSRSLKTRPGRVRKR